MLYRRGHKIVRLHRYCSQHIPTPRQDVWIYWYTRTNIWHRKYSKSIDGGDDGGTYIGMEWILMMVLTTSTSVVSSHIMRLIPPQPRYISLWSIIQWSPTSFKVSRCIARQACTGGFGGLEVIVWFFVAISEKINLYVKFVLCDLSTMKDKYICKRVS